LTSLQILHLINNRIGDDGVIALTKALKNLTSLNELYLNRNEIRDMGAAKLVEETKHLYSPMEFFLNMLDNQVSDEERAKLERTRVFI